MTEPHAAGGLAAIRGPMLSFTRDAFADGAGPAYRHEPDAVVAMAGGRITHAGPAAEVLPALPAGTPVTSYGRDALIVPGFIDCHVHYPQVRIVGAGGDTLLGWLAKHAFRAEQRLADVEAARETAQVFLRECLRHGTTTAAVYCTVHPHSATVFFEEAERLGLRMIAGKVLMDCQAPADLCDTPQRGYDESKALIARWHGRGRLGYAITPRFAPTSTPAQLAAAGTLWREHPDCWVQSHVSENAGEIAWVRELYPQARDYVDVYARAGLLGKRAIYGHGLHLRARERAALHASGTAIAHCPTSNLFLGSGLFPWPRVKQAARPLRVGLGTDVGGGTSLSMLATLAEAYKVAQMGGTSLSAGHLFHLATRGGAQALDLEGVIGSLLPGLEADFVELDCEATPMLAQRMRHAAELDDALFALLTLGDDRAVRSTWVAGRCVHRREEDPAAARGPVKRAGRHA